MSNQKSSVLIVSKSGDRVIGFNLCTTDKHNYMKGFLKKNIALIILFPSCIIPLIIAVYNKIRYRVVIEYPSTVEGIFLAVDPGFQNGTGLDLIDEMEQVLKLRNIPEYHFTVFAKNTVMVKIYKLLKYEFFAEYKTTRGKKYLVRKTLIR